MAATDPDSREDQPVVTSDDMVRSAWDRFGGAAASREESPPDTGASGDLIRRSRAWLEANAPVEVPETPSGPIPPPEMKPEAVPEVPEIELTTATPIPAPAPRPSRRPGPRPAPTPASPPGPVPTGPPTRGVQRGVLIGAVVIGFAVLSNLIGVFSDCADTVDTPDPTIELPAATVAVPELVRSSVRSFGTLTGLNPCNGEAIEGDVEAVIVFEEIGDPADPGSRVGVTITGLDLMGSEGNTYSMVLEGEAEESGVSTSYTFDSDSLIWTWGDGLTFTETATLTVTIIGGEAAQWNFTSFDSVCNQ